MIIEVNSEAEMKAFGAKMGTFLQGGEIIELVGDVGAGKTTLTKGIADGMEIDEGIMADELHETINDAQTVTIVEWAEIISGVLPTDRLTITISAVVDDETKRLIELISGGDKSDTLLGNVR